MPADDTNRTDLEVLEDDLLYMMRVRNEALNLAAEVVSDDPEQRKILVASWLAEARDFVDAHLRHHTAVTES